MSIDFTGKLQVGKDMYDTKLIPITMTSVSFGLGCWIDEVSPTTN